MKSLRWSILLLIALAMGLPQTAQAQDFYRLNLRAGFSGNLPMNKFSFSAPAEGGFARPGFGAQVGLRFQFAPGISLLGDLTLVRFPADNTGLTFYSGQLIQGAEWEILGRTIALQADFGEYQSPRVYLLAGLAFYRADTGVEDGVLGIEEPAKSDPAFAYGGGVIFRKGPLAFDLGVRLHAPRLLLSDTNVRRANWVNIEIGVIYGFFRTSRDRWRDWRP